MLHYVQVISYMIFPGSGAEIWSSNQLLAATSKKFDWNEFCELITIKQLLLLKFISDVSTATAIYLELTYALYEMLLWRAVSWNRHGLAGRPFISIWCMSKVASNENGHD